MAEVSSKIGVASEVATSTQASQPLTTAQPQRRRGSGLSFSRHFTRAGVSPYDEVEWERRNAVITDQHGTVGTSERETGVRQLIARVAETIRDWGMAGGYFRSAEDAASFHDELAHL